MGDMEESIFYKLPYQRSMMPTGASQGQLTSNLRVLLLSSHLCLTRSFRRKEEDNVQELREAAPRSLLGDFIPVR